MKKMISAAVLAVLMGSLLTPVVAADKSCPKDRPYKHCDKKGNCVCKDSAGGMSM